MSQLSPYTPGAVAKELPGRSTQLAFYAEQATRIAQLGKFIGRVRVDFAARGVGKTSLLREAQRIFEKSGIVTIWVTASEDDVLAQSILNELKRALPVGKQRLDAIVGLIDSASLTIGWGPVKGSVTVKPGARGVGSSTSALKLAIEEVTKVIVEAGSAGLVILIDEVQSADKQSLRALAAAWQEMQSNAVPTRAGLFAVGLPGSQDHITSAVTFSERFDFKELFSLDDGGVATALANPAHLAGVQWDQDALRMAVHEAKGYPYKVQLLGDETWNAAGDPDSGARIGTVHVRSGLPEVERQMDQLFASRWRNSSKKQRELLIAIAELGGDEVKREDVAARIGSSTTAISMARDGLIRKGIIHASSRGRLSFTVPGFTEYILGQS